MEGWKDEKKRDKKKVLFFLLVKARERSNLKLFYFIGKMKG
jgi:hypothetical protein